MGALAEGRHCVVYHNPDHRLKPSSVRAWISDRPGLVVLSERLRVKDIGECKRDGRGK